MAPFWAHFGTHFGSIWAAFGFQTGGPQLRCPSSLAYPFGFCIQGASETLPGPILAPFWLHFGIVFASFCERFAGLMRAGGVPRSANNLRIDELQTIGSHVNLGINEPQAIGSQKAYENRFFERLQKSIHFKGKIVHLSTFSGSRWPKPFREPGAYENRFFERL